MSRIDGAGSEALERYARFQPRLPLGMTLSDQQFADHAVHATLRDLRKTLREARKAVASDASDDQMETISRMEQVALFVENRLKAIDPVLVPTNLLAAIHNQGQKATGEMAAFATSKNPGNLNNAQAPLDSMLQSAGYLVVPLSGKEAEAMASTFKAARSSVRGWLGALKRQTNDLEQRLQSFESGAVGHSNAVAKKATEVQKSISAVETRLDDVIAQHQKQFSDAQASRQKEFTDQAEKLRDRVDSLLEGAKGEVAAEKDARAAAAKQVLDELKQKRKQADGVLEALGITSQSAAYGEFAGRERKTANTWHFVTVLALAGLIAVALWVILPELTGPFEWSAFAGRVFAGLTLAILASYGGRQAAKHSAREGFYRGMQLKLATLDPFLSLVSPEERARIKTELASRIFLASPDMAKTAETEPELLEDVLKFILKTKG